MWEKKTTVGSGANAADLHDVDNLYDWSTANLSWINAVNAERFAGFSDWRVPTKDELRGILDLNAGPPRIDPIFGLTRANPYWSSTVDDDNSGLQAWFVDFSPGYTFTADKHNGFRVRAVRPGP